MSIGIFIGREMVTCKLTIPVSSIIANISCRNIAFGTKIDSVTSLPILLSSGMFEIIF